MNQVNNRAIYEQVEIFYRRKWMIIIPLVLGTGIGILIAKSLPSYYKSSTLIMVEQQKVPESYVKPTDETPIEQRLSTISQQIMSRTKLEQIISELSLYKEKRIGYISRVKALLGFNSSSNIRSTEELVERMRKDIEVNVIGEGSGRRRGGDAFSISYIGRDPNVTRQVTDTLASLFIDENLKAREQYAEGTSEFLSDELEKAKLELENQEKALKRYKERYMGRLPQQMEANLRTLDRLQLDLQANNVVLKNAEDRKTILEDQVATNSDRPPLPEVHVPNALETELTRLKSELTSLLSTYKENYPDVVIMKSRIKDLESQLAANKGKSVKPEEVAKGESPIKPELSMDLAGINAQIEVLKKHDDDIREQIRVYQKRVEETPASEQVMADIERDYLTSQKNYQALLEKKLSARLAENMEKRQKGERFKVIDPANLPERPYKPNRTSITLAGSAIGFGIGAGLVYLFEFINPAFRRPEDFIGVLDRPVLAVIPVFSFEHNESEPRRLRLVKGTEHKH